MSFTKEQIANFRRQPDPREKWSQWIEDRKREELQKIEDKKEEENKKIEDKKDEENKKKEELRKQGFNIRREERKKQIEEDKIKRRMDPNRPLREEDIKEATIGIIGFDDLYVKALEELNIEILKRIVRQSYPHKF